MNRKNIIKIIDNGSEYIKKLLIKQKESIKNVKQDYKDAKKYGNFKGSYTKWLEVRYVELKENFDSINKHRQELLVEKYMKDSE